MVAAKERMATETTAVHILDPGLAQSYIRMRQERGIDQPDEVWDGVYVVPPLANIPHQGLVGDLLSIGYEVVTKPRRGTVYPGVNVSDRRDGWNHNFRAPDVAVVLNDSMAIDCGTHFCGGPDFLVEIRSPNDDTYEKIPFYGKVQVRELLVIDRDSRRLRLYRHDGEALVEVGRSGPDRPDWLVSNVLPLAFRWAATKKGPATEVKRTGKLRKSWKV